MKLHAKILSVTNDSNYEGMPAVEFALNDDDETGMVSFIATITQAHACFLVEHHGHHDDHTAYGQMLRYIAENVMGDIEVGKEFNDAELEG